MDLTADVQRALDQMLAVLASAGVDVSLYAPGSVHRERTLSPWALLWAYLNHQLAQIDQARDPQAVLDLQDEALRTDAVDAMLRAVFLPRAAAQPQRMLVGVRFSQAASGVIPSTWTCASGNETYKLDTAQLTYSASDMTQDVVNGGYVLSLPVVSTAPGVSPLRAGVTMQRFDPLHPLVTAVRVEAVTFPGAAAVSDQEAVAALPEALTLRQLVSPNAIATLLRADLGAWRSAVVGAGDPEMVRDVVPGIAQPVHTGGKVDVYTQTPLVLLSQTFVVGAPGVLPQDGVRYLSDWDLRARAVDHRAVMAAGQVLRLYGFGADVPSTVILREVHPDHVVISNQAPLPPARMPRVYYGGAATPMTFDGAVTFTVTQATSPFVGNLVGRTLLVTSQSLGRSFALVVAATSDDRFGTGAYDLEVVIDEATQLLIPTGEVLTGVLVEFGLRYSVGTNHPDYNNVVAERPFGAVVGTGSVAGAVTLPDPGVCAVSTVEVSGAGVVPSSAATQTRLLTTHLGDPSPSPQAGYWTRWSDEVLARSDRSRLRLYVSHADTRAAQSASVYPGDTDDQVRVVPRRGLFRADDVGQRYLLTGAASSPNTCRARVLQVIHAREAVLELDGGRMVGSAFSFERGVRVAFDAAWASHGWRVRVGMLTSTNLVLLQAYLSDPARRPSACDLLARAPVVLWLTVRMAWERSRTATGALPAQTIREGLSAFVQSFPVGEVLHLDDLCTQARSISDVIGAIRRTSETYALVSVLLPSGRLVQMRQVDRIGLDPATCTTGPGRDALEAALGAGLSSRLCVVFMRPSDVELTQIVEV